jgi:two-component system, cell cycle sensor histidine kinase and response regulator CckA
VSTVLRALIVEDSADDAKLLLRELRRGGYEVVCERVETPEDMNAALERAPWDIIISDYSMPHFSAPAALDALKNHKLDIPFIIVSGTIGEDTAVDAMQAGAQDFLVKGNLARLIPALERELREARSRRERRQADAALRQSEERFNEIADLIDEVFWVSDPEISRILYMSPAYERVWGRTVRSLYDNPESYFDAIHPSDRERVLAYVKAQRLQPFDHEYRIVLPDGSVRWIWERDHPVRDDAGKVQRHVGVAIDITRRKRAEEALLRSMQRLELAQKAGKIGTFEWDIASGKMVWAPELEALYGLPPGGFKGQFDDWKEAIHPSDRDRAERELFAALQSKSDVDTTFRIVWPDRSLHWMTVRSTVFYNEQGEPSRMIGINADITEYRKLEEQFRQAQKMEAVGRLAGGVAHDFNNLLTVVTGYTELLQALLGEETEPQKYAAEILAASNRGAALTRQLLALSRQQVLEPRVLNINDVVMGMENMLRRLIGEDIRMAVVCQPDAGAVRADRGQIEQVIMNLAVNARDAMPTGGTLTIETANVLLDQSYVLSHPITHPGPHVMLAVTDTGHGMDEATMSRIFEPFFTTKEVGKGTGLGLATVYGIVKQSDGNIWVYSELDQGTTFKIYFPCVDKTPAPAEKAEPAAAQSAGSETILLAEDDESLRTLVRGVLASRGYKVLGAGRPEEVLAIARGHLEPIHLLVTDVIMPDIRGPELADRVAVLHPEARTLFMSGYTDRSIEDPGIKKEGRAFLQKPFSPDLLLRKVREILDSPLPPQTIGQA